MKLSELTYMCLEQITSNAISDDQEIDYRLVEDWIKMKRAVLLRQKPRADIGLNNLQQYEVTMGASANSYPTTKLAYPFVNTTTQTYSIHTSTLDIPKILEDDWGPIIFDITSSDKLKLPYSYKPYHELRFCGNGRFNSNLIYISLLNHKLIAKANAQITADIKIILTAIFEDPEAVTGFDSATMDFPCSLDIMEAIKLSIFDKDFKIYLATNKIEDTENSANDEQ